MRLKSFFLFIFLYSAVVSATTVTETFISNKNLDSAGGMVWNISLGELHPPLQVVAWDDGGGPYTSPPYSVGDGRDGAFVASRYRLFDTNGVISGGVIEINTDTYPELQFTDFNLAVGYTLRPTGSKPLVIRIQGSAVVDGDIDCSGDNGVDGVSNVNTLRVGGSGRCGGGDGGDSVSPGSAPNLSNQGGAGGISVTGGAGGPIRLASGGQGGGGGGAYTRSVASGGTNPDPTHGDDSLGGAGGAFGTIFRDDGFTSDIDGAGSGGGGGSAFDHAGDVPSHSSGASGGAGGGSIRIYVVGDLTVSASGRILANGGEGGSVGGGLKGGAGGGGGGGSILIFAGGDLVFDGVVSALPGAAGVTAGGDGGVGAYGRTFIVEKDGFAAGAVVEDPVTELITPGNVSYETGVTYTVTSKAIDLGNSEPTITSLPMTIANLGGSTLVYNLAFSDSSSLASLTGFNLDSTYLSTTQPRFARFEIQVDNLNALTPVRIQDLGFEYTGAEQDEFNYITGCGFVNTNMNMNMNMNTYSSTNMNTYTSMNMPSQALMLFIIIFLCPVALLFLFRWQLRSSFART